MSAFSHTSWTVYCDHRACWQQVTDDSGTDRKVTRASLRRYLARRGWTTNVDACTRNDGKDFCPDHKPAEQRQEASDA